MIMSWIIKLASKNPSFRKSLIEKLGGRPKVEHKPGDVWKTPTAWRSMNSKGQAKTFDTQEEAKAHSKSEGKDRSKKPRFPKKRIHQSIEDGTKFHEERNKLVPSSKNYGGKDNTEYTRNRRKWRPSSELDDGKDKGVVRHVSKKRRETKKEQEQDSKKKSR